MKEAILRFLRLRSRVPAGVECAGMCYFCCAPEDRRHMPGCEIEQLERVVGLLDACRCDTDPGRCPMHIYGPRCRCAHYAIGPRRCPAHGEAVKTGE